jgi:hypothetical protein
VKVRKLHVNCAHILEASLTEKTINEGKKKYDGMMVSWIMDKNPGASIDIYFG